LKGAEIKRYTKPQAQYKIIYPYHIKDNKAEIIPENIMKTQYVDVYDYLKESESILRQREKGKFNNDERYSYSRNQNIAMMPFPKILTQVLSKRSSITIDDS
jgi:hypothetical protein